MHLQDLALAQACSRGSATAWERFVSLYQKSLYATAVALVKSDTTARELSDSLWGDLFDASASVNGTCSSKLASYSGRGSLEGWLKTVLTRRYLDQCRGQRHVVSLDDGLTAIRNLCIHNSPSLAESVSGEPPWKLLNTALEEACARCTSEERFLLAAYFFDGQTLAALAQTLGIHESTVSRRIDRLILKLRRRIKQTLRETGMSARQIEESLHSGQTDLPLNIRGLLLRGVDLARG